MKKIILGILGMLMSTYGLQAQGIVKAEYYFDKDPGVGKGTTLAVTPGDSINVNASIPLGALSGYHNLFIRAQDSAGHWSLYEGRNFYVQPSVTIPAPAMIVAAEYFFDKDPGQGKGTPISAFGATDSASINTAISIASLSTGFHNMFIRTENASGQWSLYEGRNFYIQPSVTIPAPAMIVAAEYFFDKDPGQGKGTPISAFGATDSASINTAISVASLTSGFHNMFIRTENANGQWSLYEGRNFYVQPSVAAPAAPMIVAAEYFFDKDPGQGKGTPMSAFAATDSVSISTAISLASLPTGFHNIFVRTENSNGQWSLYEGRNFYVQPSVVAQPTSRIVSAEYFFDKDPGQGKGTNVIGISTADSINIAAAISVASLSNGSHNVFVRSKDSTGHWSLYQGAAFKVQNCTDSVSVASTKDSCFGGNDGTATAFVKGGYPPYTYSWNTTPIQTSITAKGLTAGQYTITVTDSVGCPAIATVVVGQPTQIKIKPTVSNATCGTNNGIISLKVTGGTGTSYSYLWTNGSTSSSISGLTPGTYSVSVFDKYSCSASTSVTVTAVSTPTISVASITSSLCGKYQGAVSVTTSGGAAPYRYSWNNGDTLPTESNLAAGNYIITVTDTNHCSTYVSAAVTNSNGPKITATSLTSVKCYGQQSGAIAISVTNGVTPYTYLWSTGVTTQNISNLYAGPYYVTVTDTSSCSGIQTFNVPGPSAPISIAISTTNSACSSPTGTAKAITTGGTAPYTLNWSSGETTDTADGLYAGAYTVTVTDSNSCVSSTQVAVSSANGPVIKIDSITASICTKGAGTGAVIITVTGGTGTPYTYSWSNASNSATQNLYNVTTGIYNVQVSDAVGCISTATANVPEVVPAPVAICMVTVDPATNHNTIIWDQSGAKDIEKYNIYKETTAPGLFTKIASVPANDSSIYVDVLSNPDVQSWRYEISQVDSCGFESPLSNPHKTMHLTINSGSSGTNLIWDNYEGFHFDYYIVYRDSVVGVAKDSIGYVINNGTYTYTDPLVSKTPVYYHMGVANPNGCDPSARLEAINYNATKSNTGNVTFVSVNSINTDLNSLTVYPNPSTGVFNFSMNIVNKQNIMLKIYNDLGQVLAVNNYGRVSGQINKEIDLSGLSKGVYILQVIGDSGVAYKKVVLQ